MPPPTVRLRTCVLFSIRSAAALSAFAIATWVCIEALRTLGSMSAALWGYAPMGAWLRDGAQADAAVGKNGRRIGQADAVFAILDRGACEIARDGNREFTACEEVGGFARNRGQVRLRERDDHARPFADVQLATDPKSSIDVILPRTGSRGVLKGVASDTRYLCRIEYLVQKDEVQVGDTVTTSGLGAIFPRDVFVGKVVRLRRTDASLYQEVEVEPSVDFGKLREVLIVLSPPPAPDPDLGKRPTDSARGVGIPR